MKNSPPQKRREPKEGTASSVGALFRSARQLQELSQDQLVILAGGQISRTAISDIERGRNLPGLETLASLASLLHVDPSEVIERVRLASRVPVDVTNWSVVELRKRASEHYWSRDYRKALAYFDAAVERLALEEQQSDPDRNRILAKLEVERATTLRQIGALKAARASAERATQIATGVEKAEAYTVLSSLLSKEGLHDLALNMAMTATDLADCGTARTRSHAESQLASCYFRQGAFDQALDHFNQARRMAAKSRDRRGVAAIEGNIASSLDELGFPEKAKLRFERAIKLAQDLGDEMFEASWLIDLGRVHLETGSIELAESCAARANQLARRGGHDLHRFCVEWLMLLIARRVNPRAAMARRLSSLKKLYVRVRDHKGQRAVREFAEEFIERSPSK